MALEGEELLQFINSTLPDTLSIDYNSNNKLSQEEADQVTHHLKAICEFPRRYNQSCIIGTCDFYYRSVFLFPCCGYNHAVCEKCLKEHLTNVGLKCPMCRSNIIENVIELQPSQKLNIEFGLSPNEETNFFQNKKHAEIGHYTGYEVLINNSNASVSFKKATFCMKVFIPKNGRNENTMNIRREWVFYKNINLKTQKKIMKLVLWYQENYTNNKFHNEIILWNLICDITAEFKEICCLLKKEFQNKNYMKLYDNFIDCIYNVSKKYLKSNTNENNLDTISLLINREKANYLNISTVRNNNYQNEIDFIDQNCLKFYHTSMNDIKEKIQKFVAKFNCMLNDNILKSEKCVFLNTANICSNMASIHQFIISYLNCSDLDNSLSETNHIEQQYLKYLSEIYNLLFKHLDIYIQSNMNRSKVYSESNINKQIDNLRKKLTYSYNYLMVENTNIRKISFPIISFSNGFIASTQNRLNLIDKCVAHFNNWLLQKLSNSNETISDYIWNFITLEMHYFNNSQKYFHVLSYQTISDIIKSHLVKLKEKVEKILNNLNNSNNLIDNNNLNHRNNGNHNIILPNFNLLS